MFPPAATWTRAVGLRGQDIIIEVKVKSTIKEGLIIGIKTLLNTIFITL